MSEDKKPVKIDELILSNTFSISAIMNVLEKKDWYRKKKLLQKLIDQNVKWINKRRRIRGNRKWGIKLF